MFHVHRSSYRYWLNKAKTPSPETLKLREFVRDAYAISHGSAGARTIADIVTNQGVPLSRYRASKLMKQLDLHSCQLPAHRYRKATQEHVEIPNYLERQFAVTAQTKFGVLM